MLHDEGVSSVQRNVGLLAATTLTIMAGATIAPSLPQLQRHFFDTPNIDVLAKLVLTLPALTIAICSLPIGRAADKIGHRGILVTSCFVYAGAGASGYFVDSLAGLLIGRAILGAAVGGIMTCATALVAAYFEQADRTKFLGWQSATSSFGGLIFLTTGGWLAEMQWRMPFLIYLLAAPIGLFLILSLPKPSAPTAGGSRPMPSEVESTNWPVIWFATLLAWLGMLAFYLTPTSLPFHLEQKLGTSATMTGVAIGLLTLVAGFASLLNQRLRQYVGFHSAMSFVFFAMGCGYLLTSLANAYWIVLVAMALSGAGLGLMMPNLTSRVIANVSRNDAGRASGLLTSSLFLGQFLSPIFLTPVRNWLDSGGTFGFCGVALLIAASLLAVRAFVVRARQHRDQ